MKKRLAAELKRIGEALIEIADSQESPTPQQVETIRRLILELSALLQRLVQPYRHQKAMETEERSDGCHRFISVPGLMPTTCRHRQLIALLINALDHGSTPRKIKAAKKMLQKANPRHLIGDSSGFQIHQAEKKREGDNVRSQPPDEKHGQGIEHIAAAGHGGERHTSARYRHWA